VFGGPIASYITIFNDQSDSTPAHYILSIVLDRLSAAYDVFLYLIFRGHSQSYSHQAGRPIESYVTIFSDQGKSTSAHYMLSIVLDRLSAAYDVFLYLIFKAIVREQWSLSSRMASCPSAKTFVSLTKYPMGHYLMIRNVYEAVGLSDSNGYTLSNVGFTDSDPLPFGHVPNAYVVSSGRCVWHTFCI